MRPRSRDGERELIERQEPRPVDASGPSAADLHRYFCGPWCPKCGFTTDKAIGSRCDQCCTLNYSPGLHTRDPRTKVEGLEWIEAGGYWSSTITINRAFELAPAHAADLLVMGVVKAAALFTTTHTSEGWDASVMGYPGTGVATAPTLPEAVAIAYHRMLDAEEQGA